jgi:hypothetical protein
MNDRSSTNYSFLFIPFLYPVENFSEVIFLLEKFHHLEKRKKKGPCNKYELRLLFGDLKWSTMATL